MITVCFSPSTTARCCIKAAKAFESAVTHSSLRGDIISKLFFTPPALRI
jgi:hypothetical protein